MEHGGACVQAAFQIFAFQSGFVGLKGQRSEPIPGAVLETLRIENAGVAEIGRVALIDVVQQPGIWHEIVFSERVVTARPAVMIAIPGTITSVSVCNQLERIVQAQAQRAIPSLLGGGSGFTPDRFGVGSISLQHTAQVRSIATIGSHIQPSGG